MAHSSQALDMYWKAKYTAYVVDVIIRVVHQRQTYDTDILIVYVMKTTGRNYDLCNNK